MRLVPVSDPRPGQTLKCCHCHTMRPAAEMVANLDGLAFVDYYCRACRAWARDPYYEIQPADVGKPFLDVFGRSRRVADFIGRILPGDVGKRVYQRSGVLQVENDDQRAAREREEGRHAR